MYKLKTINETSWILQKDEQNYGMITKNLGKYTLLANSKKSYFEDLVQLSEYLGTPLTENKDVTNTKYDIVMVNDLPIKCDKYYPEETDLGIPGFRKKQSITSTIYCAGYFCIKRKQKWGKIFCPKIETLKEHEWKGPFKNISEAKANLLELNGKARKNKKNNCTTKCS